jgi:hypothetical protein
MEAYPPPSPNNDFIKSIGYDANCNASPMVKLGSNRATMKSIRPLRFTECDDQEEAPRGNAKAVSRWTCNDEQLLRVAVDKHGKDWNAVCAAGFEKARTPEECKNRYHEVIEKNIKRGPWTKEEDELVRTMVLDILKKDGKLK